MSCPVSTWMGDCTILIFNYLPWPIQPSAFSGMEVVYVMKLYVLAPSRCGGPGVLFEQLCAVVHHNCAHHMHTYIMSSSYTVDWIGL